jgi:hypothetical protein
MPNSARSPSVAKKAACRARMVDGSFPPVSETFTVIGCVPTSEEQCKNGGYEQFGFENQGRCIKAVKQRS